MQLPGKPILWLNDLEVTDHNRAPLSVTFNEISSGDRTVSGTYRSYIVARKHTISTSWELLPSRSFYTVDNFMGGQELHEFYLKHPTFKVGVYNDLSSVPDAYFPSIDIIGRFSDFNYSIVKRNVEGEFYDFWNVNITIEEI